MLLMKHRLGCCYISAGQSGSLAGGGVGVMFSTVRPSVRPCFHSFVCYQTCEHDYFENERTYFDANWHKLPTDKGIKRSIFGSGNHRSKRSKSHEAENIFGGLAEASFSIPLGRVGFRVLPDNMLNKKT